MSTKSLGVVAVMVFCISLQASAQNRFELTPFFGATKTGGFDIDNPDISRLEVRSGVTYGASVGCSLTDYIQVEFLFAQQESAIYGVPKVQLDGADGDVRLFGARLDQFHGNIMYQFGEPGDNWRPFLMIGAGATTFRAAEGFGSRTRFSVDFGGGIKHYFSPRLGVRGQIRALGTHMSSGSDGLWCGPYGCYVISKSNYLGGAEFSGGLIIRF